MRKLLQFLDKKIIKIGVGLIIAFTALYPKLPSLGIAHTWVYIRVEDFLIALVTGIWLVQLVRKKVKLALPVGNPIIIYWIIGFVSLAVSLIFIAPHLANFFPSVAILSYVRRIEYMILFFVAFSTVKSTKDVIDYVVILMLTVFVAVIYGFGQRFYLDLWALFPSFFEKYSFCFPSFQTGNEEFAKGVPLCLPAGARITSTFGGHYDLAAYLVLVIPIFVGVFFAVKRIMSKVLVGLLTILSIMLLIFTASRTSFAAYLVGLVCTLFFIKKKKYIVPIVGISIILLLTFSGSTAKRFLETFRFASIVTNKQGQVVGETASNLPQALQDKISKNPVIVGAPPPTQNLPVGSSFIPLQINAPVATSVAVVQSSVSNDTSKQLNLEFGGIEISTVSGSFLVQKALVYDISFTTRFQGEWPRDFRAFLSDPPLGTGYSSLTLASDNDFLRALGETGFLGLISFLLIFAVLGIFLTEEGSHMPTLYGRVFVFSLAGGIIGLMANAVLIDVFEASKVAEITWILLGIGAGILALYQKAQVPYMAKLKNIMTSNIFVAFYLLIGLFIVFSISFANFFVADDFTWLHWAATSTMKDIATYFFNAQGFFYRPIDKAIMFFLYMFFSFQPVGYHLLNLLLHWLTAFGVFLLAEKLLRKRWLALFAAFFFLLLPAHGEDVFWISTISNNVSAVFLIFALVAFIIFREKKSIVAYCASIALTAGALLSYEMSIVAPLFFIITDLCIIRPPKNTKTMLAYIPYVLLAWSYLVVRTFVGAVSLGGDYAYNIAHFIPNVLGNLVGYYGLLIGGEHFLPVYTFMRAALRTYGVLMTVIIGVCCISGFLLFKKRKIALHKLSNRLLILYLILFSVIALLPVLGLGNIAERYVYFASISFAILAVYVLARIASFICDFKPAMCYAFITFCIIIIPAWFVHDLLQTNSQWQHAGTITKNTLSIFRADYQYIPPSSRLFFVNIPIRQKNAWIFPVGLADGLWFIYRDTTLHVYQVHSIAEAKSIEKNLPDITDNKNYIFSFDQKGNLSVVQ